MKAVEHTVGLAKAYNFPAPKRAVKALALIKKFAGKHFRANASQVSISRKVNEMVWQNGREKPPRKLELSFFVEDQKLTVLPKGVAQKMLEKAIKKEKEKKQKKKKKALEKKGVPAKTSQKTEEKEKQEKKLKEKRFKEKAGEKAALKRKTG